MNSKPSIFTLSTIKIQNPDAKINFEAHVGSKPVVHHLWGCFLQIKVTNNKNPKKKQKTSYKRSTQNISSKTSKTFPTKTSTQNLQFDSPKLGPNMV